MLKLRKVQLLGFKSFCDRTEVPLAGHGIAAIVGPNGCGKSNISDAITWVLGEQSAKSLRGIKMEDVIFAGTRDRKATGMAEVSLTLVDPDVYDGHIPENGPELVINNKVVSDWDEAATRAEAAAETEAAVIDAQPGQTYEAPGGKKKKVLHPHATAEEIAAAGEAIDEDEEDRGGHSVHDALATEATLPGAELNPNSDVVLKIRRRKFNQAPVRAGEITITRRLFRTGDSEYLLNGKICRLRDIQDIFMGTGLGGETYAIIGQERIGQLLSSKPLDRRGIIEEAAGITRFKTKKRLAELRLEAAKQNLSRVNDIFEEVTRQMGSLKRQAAKAERFQAVQTELRGKLTIVLASRLAQMDAERIAVSADIDRLTALVDKQSAALETMDAEHTAGIEHGYGLDQQVREVAARASQSAVELERIAARTTANADRVTELTERLAAGQQDLTQAQAQLATLAAEQEQHRSFLETATAEADSARAHAQHQQQQSVEAGHALSGAEQRIESERHRSLTFLQRAAQAQNAEAQAAAALQGLERESERLAAESSTAHHELESLGAQSGQIKLGFESVTTRLAGLESEIADLRSRIESRRAEETASRRRADDHRAQLATLTGRRSSLEALIREHSYSTDTVRDLFRRFEHSSDLKPLGTLADFLEVDAQYESIVDEFLRDELNYIVVESWDAAGNGIRLLENDINGRATFLIHAAPSGGPFIAESHPPMSGEAQTLDGATPLRDHIRVLNGFGRSLETILPKLGNGYIAPDAHTACTLAQAHPGVFVLAPSGEAFHNLTVTGGRPREQGPLALKRELHEVQHNLAAVEAELSQTELATHALERELAELTSALEARSHERRDAERESANSGAALRQMEAETARIEARLQQWQLAAARNQDSRGQQQDIIARKREEAFQLEAERAQVESQLSELVSQVAGLRANREQLQLAASEASAALAGLEERRRNASANYEQTARLFNGQQSRITQLEQQLEQSSNERRRREEETATLAAQHAELAEVRAAAVAEGEALTAQATALRNDMTALDHRLRTLRHETEALRENRSDLSARSARLSADIEHLEAACLNDLALEPIALRENTEIARIEAEALIAAEEEARTLKQRLEAMGPVNMMALEEYTETAERHAFLETQRTDLIDSIENTQASIKEIDEVSREKFDQAFKVINENFAATFTKLFGGGAAMMRLTDDLNPAESGIDIIASPPGKKLQNVLLLSGGEKALTALSLLVGIFQFQPAPFCILDEVDAPLDDTNVGRFARLIAEMAQTTQFIVITHSKRTMEQADVMYGVTMQEPGVSKIVSVSLNSNQDRRRVA